MIDLNIKKVLPYLYTKLIGTGFSFSVIIFFVAMMNSFDLYFLSRDLSHMLLWTAFYGYAFLFIMDGIAYFLLAGTIGALAAIL